MPQPLRSPSKPGNISISLNLSRISSSHNDHAIRMASIITSWAALEGSFGPLFKTLTKAPSLTQSTATINSLSSFRAKCALLESASGVFEDSKIKAEFSKHLVGPVKKAYTRRNDVAHGIWGTNEKVPGKLVLLAYNGESLNPPMIYGIADHDESLQWIKVAMDGLLRFKVMFEHAQHGKLEATLNESLSLLIRSVLDGGHQ